MFTFIFTYICFLYRVPFSYDYRLKCVVLFGKWRHSTYSRWFFFSIYLSIYLSISFSLSVNHPFSTFLYLLIYLFFIFSICFLLFTHFTFPLHHYHSFYLHFTFYSSIYSLFLICIYLFFYAILPSISLHSSHLSFHLPTPPSSLPCTVSPRLFPNLDPLASLYLGASLSTPATSQRASHSLSTSPCYHHRGKNSLLIRRGKQ